MLPVTRSSYEMIFGKQINQNKKNPETARLNEIQLKEKKIEKNNIVKKNKCIWFELKDLSLINIQRRVNLLKDSYRTCVSRHVGHGLISIFFLYNQCISMDFPLVNRFPSVLTAYLF